MLPFVISRSQPSAIASLLCLCLAPPALAPAEAPSCARVEWDFFELSYGVSATADTDRDSVAICDPASPQFWCGPVTPLFAQHFAIAENSDFEPCACDTGVDRGDTCANADAAAMVDCSIEQTVCGLRIQHRFEVFADAFADACEPESCFVACAQAETCWSFLAKFRLLRAARVRLIGDCPYRTLLIRDADGQQMLILPASSGPTETTPVLLHSSYATGSLYVLEGEPLNLFTDATDDDCPAAKAATRATEENPPHRAASDQQNAPPQAEGSPWTAEGWNPESDPPMTNPSAQGPAPLLPPHDDRTVTRGTLELVIDPLPSGDMNCDGAVTQLDIPGFVRALVDPTQYPALHPECEIFVGDFTGDGNVSFADLGPFARALLG